MSKKIGKRELDRLKKFEDTILNLKDEDAPIVIDARSSERFNGLIEDPR